MDKKQFVQIHRRNIVYFLICASAIVAFILIVLYPSQRSLRALENEMTDIVFQVKEQKRLSPLYETLVEEMQIKESDVLPAPIEGTLSIDKIEEISVVFDEMTKMCNLKAVSIIPDVNSLTRSAKKSLLVNLFVKGGFFDFRCFLIELGKIAYLEHIEEIHIKRGVGGKEFKLKVWLTLS